MPAADDAATVAAAIADAHRVAWAAVLAATVRVARDIDLAEECGQEAYADAVTRWATDGVPTNPTAWLVTVARRRAVDAIRRERTLRDKLPLLVVTPDDDPPSSNGDVVEADLRDERLRLVFLCCHPALEQAGQVALTLRLVCGLSTHDIARAFLVSDTTMSARLTRAKRKIAVAGIPFRLPPRPDLAARVRGVLATIHLLFTTGHTSVSAAELHRVDLCEQALQLARLLRQLLPAEPEVDALLALMLATHARRATRTDAAGRLVALADQDRARWDTAAIAEAADLLHPMTQRPDPGRYALQAAIALLHAQAPTYQQTDWRQILTCYDLLAVAWPSPVVVLNRAVALSQVEGPVAALDVVRELEQDGRLSGYHYLGAVKADLLERLGRTDDAIEALRATIDLTENPVERAHLAHRLDVLTRPGPIGPPAGAGD